ncbi:unnamed protein product [Polarella glacialis]|uniref:Uncharacterized protein n=1 Tax=Polarella glacialis TaxID=89957 RepID=A0A813K0E4_POLGL|nr:unnamed protein product [Polarella glacialis]
MQLLDASGPLSSALLEGKQHPQLTEQSISYRPLHPVAVIVRPVHPVAVIVRRALAADPKPCDNWGMLPGTGQGAQRQGAGGTGSQAVEQSRATTTSRGVPHPQHGSINKEKADDDNDVKRKRERNEIPAKSHPPATALSNEAAAILKATAVGQLPQAQAHTTNTTQQQNKTNKSLQNNL